jgi:hypothetical protein
VAAAFEFVEDGYFLGWTIPDTAFITLDPPLDLDTFLRTISCHWKIAFSCRVSFEPIPALKLEPQHSFVVTLHRPANADGGQQFLSLLRAIAEGTKGLVYGKGLRVWICGHRKIGCTLNGNRQSARGSALSDSRERTLSYDPQSDLMGAAPVLVAACLSYVFGFEARHFR